MNETQNNFAVGETVIFSGEPNKKPYPVLQIIIFAVVFIAICVADGFLMGASVFKAVAGESVGAQIALFALSFLVHVIPVGVWAYDLTKAVFLAKTVGYIMTDKKVSLSKGFDVRSESILNLADVTKTVLKKDRIVFFSREEKLVFSGLNEAEKIYGQIYKITKK